MSNIIDFPSNGKKIITQLNKATSKDEHEQALIHEWLMMLKDIVVDLDALELSHPLYLKTYLSLFSQDEILKMGQFLGFTDIQFHREEELLDFISIQYNANFSTIMSRLPLNALMFLKHMSAYEGRYYFEEASTLMEVLDFIHLGMGFLVKENQKQQLVLTQDVMEQLENIDWEVIFERGQLNTDVLALTQGMLFCYGVMSQQEIVHLLDELMGLPLESDDVLGMLFMQCELGATFMADEHLMWDNLVENPKVLYEKIVERKDLPRKHFTKSELIAYANRPTTYSNNLLQWLQKGHRELPTERSMPRIIPFERPTNS